MGSTGPGSLAPPRGETPLNANWPAAAPRKTTSLLSVPSCRSPRSTRRSPACCSLPRSDAYDVCSKSEPRKVARRFFSAGPFPSTEWILTIDLLPRHSSVLRFLNAPELPPFMPSAARRSTHARCVASPPCWGARKWIRAVYRRRSWLREGEGGFSTLFSMGPAGGLVVFHDIVPAAESGAPTAGDRWVGGVPLFCNEVKPQGRPVMGVCRKLDARRFWHRCNRDRPNPGRIRPRMNQAANTSEPAGSLPAKFPTTPLS